MVRRKNFQVKVGLLLCLCFVTAVAQENWKNRKNLHIRRVSGRSLATEDILYFANDLQHNKHFRQVLNKILIPRAPGTKGRDTVRDFIKGTMENLGWSTELDSFTDATPDGPIDFHNVIATLDPDAPRRLVIACHYDTITKRNNYVGATDSAVPCAQMINLAYALRRDLNEDKQKRSELTLQLIFFDGEEAIRKWRGKDNTYGSRHLAKKWESERYIHDGVEGNTLDRIDVFVLLDLIGVKDQQFFSLQQSGHDWYERMALIEQRLANNGAFIQYPKQPYFKKARTLFGNGIQDDHMPFLKRGTAVVHIIPPQFPSVWHKDSDDAGALHMPSIANLNKIFRVFVADYLMLE